MFRILVEMLFVLLYYFLCKLVLAFATGPIGSFLADTISDNLTREKLLSSDNRKVSYESNIRDILCFHPEMNKRFLLF